MVLVLWLRATSEIVDRFQEHDHGCSGMQVQESETDAPGEGGNTLRSLLAGAQVFRGDTMKFRDGLT